MFLWRVCISVARFVVSSASHEAIFEAMSRALWSLER